MADIRINTTNMKQYADRLNNVCSRVQRLDQRVNQLYYATGLLGLYNIMRYDSVSIYRERLIYSRDYLYQTASDFEAVERELSNLNPQSFSASQVNQYLDRSQVYKNALKYVKMALGGCVSWILFGSDQSWNIYKRKKENTTNLFGTDITSIDETSIGNMDIYKKKGKIGAKVSAFKKSSKVKSKFLGETISLETTETYLENDLNGKLDNKWKNSISDKGIDLTQFGVAAKLSDTFVLHRKEFNGKWGFSSFTFGEEDGRIDTSVEGKATLWDDSGLSPSFKESLKLSGVVKRYYLKQKLGDDQYGTSQEINLDGLYASGEAKAGIGYLGKDKNGEQKYGIVAQVDAMAALAKLTANRKITIAGVDINVDYTQYYGAVGATYGGSIDTNGAFVDLSGALEAGVGLKVGLDWTDAEWIRTPISNAIKNVVVFDPTKK